MAALLKVQWVKSKIGQLKNQRATLKGLGFRRMQQVRYFKDDPIIRGMLVKVNHLVTIKEVAKEEKAANHGLETYRLGAKSTAKPKAVKPKKPAATKTAAKATESKKAKKTTKANESKKKAAAPKKAKTTKGKA